MADIFEVYNRCGSCRHFSVSFTDRMNRTMGECRGRPTHPEVAAHDYGCPEYHMDRERIVPGTPIPPEGELSPRQRDVARRIESLRLTQGAARHTTEKMRMVRDVALERAPAKNPQATVRLVVGADRTGGAGASGAPGDTEDQHNTQEDIMQRGELKALLAEVLDEALGLGDTPIHPRYVGGKVIVQPGNPELQAKELDIDTLFRKVVAVREKLRVLEQKINSSDKLDGPDKLQIHQYITSCYGSMTSFNFLFRDREDWFVGESSR